MIISGSAHHDVCVVAAMNVYVKEQLRLADKRLAEDSHGRPCHASQDSKIALERGLRHECTCNVLETLAQTCEWLRRWPWAGNNLDQTWAEASLR